jgi:hypothetical protein
MTLADFGFAAGNKTQDQVETYASERPVNTAAVVTKSALQDHERDEAKERWIQICEQQRESYLYRMLTYCGKVLPDGSRVEHVMDSETFEKLWKGSSQSYGGFFGGGLVYGSKEQLVDLREELLNWKNRWLSIPYHKAKADDFIFRGVRAENIRVFFTPKAKEMIERVAGWSVDDFLRELDDMIEPLLTQEYERKADRYFWVDKRMDELSSLIYDRKSVLTKMVGEDNTPSQTILFESPEYESKRIGRLFQELQNWKDELARLEKEKKILRSDLIRGEN